MGIKTLKPVTPGQRGMSRFDFKEITKKDPEKSLLSPLKKKAGRNNKGRVTSWHRGGGHKRRYKNVDFKRTKMEIPANVASVEYDPNRSSRVALLNYKDGAKAYILAPVGLKPGTSVISSTKADIKPGNTLPLKDIPSGTVLHNVEMKPGKGGQIARSAGTQAVLVAKDKSYCQVKLPSGEVRQVPSSCKATVGQVGNTDHENLYIGKAGRVRWKGRRPIVRGMAMNPIDHPLGGGEGVGKGNHPMTPWGKSCKGLKTRTNKRTNKMIVKRRAKNKKR